ncbi:hypothetical protein LXL04_011804 [Taraxacum kok-saghyz]
MVLTLWTHHSHSIPTNEKKLYGLIMVVFLLKKRYVNGIVDYFDFVDADLFSVHEFEDMFRICRYRQARHKPFITCLEYIREYLMRRICSVQKDIDKLQGPLTPIATTLLEKAKKEAAEYRVIFSGNGKYQDLTGIPCKHAVCVMFDKIDNREQCGELEEWVHDCYKLHMWKISQCPFTLTHPKHHTQVGRPKKKSKRGLLMKHQVKEKT